MIEAIDLENLQIYFCGGVLACMFQTAQPKECEGA
jgi:hypothetical protein